MASAAVAKAGATAPPLSLPRAQARGAPRLAAMVVRRSAGARLRGAVQPRAMGRGTGGAGSSGQGPFNGPQHGRGERERNLLNAVSNPERAGSEYGEVGYSNQSLQVDESSPRRLRSRALLPSRRRRPRLSSRCAFGLHCWSPHLHHPTSVHPRCPSQVGRRQLPGLLTCFFGCCKPPTGAGIRPVSGVGGADTPGCGHPQRANEDRGGAAHPVREQQDDRGRENGAPRRAPAPPCAATPRLPDRRECCGARARSARGAASSQCAALAASHPCRHSMRPDEAHGLIFNWDNVVVRARPPACVSRPPLPALPMCSGPMVMG